MPRDHPGGHSVIILFQQFNALLFASYSRRVPYNEVSQIIAPGLLHTVRARVVDQVIYSNLASRACVSNHGTK